MASPANELFRYTLKSTGDSSSKYGPCECCNHPASEVFIQCETKAFEVEGHTAWTYHGARGHTFGHRDCLIASRTTKIATAA